MILEGNKIRVVLPYIGSLLIFSGYIKIAFIYKHFSINISDFLDLSEVLTIFLPDIVKYFFIIFFINFIDFIAEPKADTEKYHAIKMELVETEDLWKRMKLHFKLHKGLFYLNLIWLIFFFINMILNRSKIWTFIEQSFVLPAFFIFNLGILEFRHKYKLVYGKHFNPTYNNLILTAFLFGLFVFGSALSHIEDIEKGKMGVVSFTYNDNFVQIKGDTVFVGQTKTYFFAYVKSEKKALVYRRSDLQSFSLIKPAS